MPELYKITNCPSFEKREIIGDNPNIAGRTLKKISINASGEYAVRSLGLRFKHKEYAF